MHETRGGRPMRILVVEDEERMAAYLVKSLQAEGFDVDTAADGEAALEKALVNSYDAITLDIMLPKLNGYDVCRGIRAAGKDTPVLMLTAKDGEYDEADALDIGADDFLRKPFSLVVLTARLRALVRRGGAERGAVLTLDDLSIDEGTRSVTRAGRSIELTPREFALLEYLVRNAGQTLTKQQLLERVWGSEFMGDVNIVEVYIGYLRKKVDAPFDVKLIQTVRGVGYRAGGE